MNSDNFDDWEVIEIPKNWLLLAAVSWHESMEIFGQSTGWQFDIDQSIHASVALFDKLGADVMPESADEAILNNALSRVINFEEIKVESPNSRFTSITICYN